MKSNESDVTSGQPVRESDLPELAVRILSDFERIVTAEAGRLESNVISATQVLLDRLYIESILIALAAIGITTVLLSVALLLHQWMEWWKALGLLGVCVLVAAEVLRRSLILKHFA